MVEYFGRLNGLDEPTLKKRVDDIFARLDMNSFRDRRCDKLSTGMKQKTSIARTLIHDPQVMIFDEPTLGLDIMTARTIIGFIRECRERGKTVIFSTHVMSEVEKLCDIIGIIQSGKLLAEGSLAELRERYGEQDLEEIFVKIVAPLLHQRRRPTDMSLRNVGIVYRKELREALRDRRTLISTADRAVDCFSAVDGGHRGAGHSTLIGKAKEEIPKVMILGGEDSPQLLERLRRIEKIDIVPLTPATGKIKSSTKKFARPSKSRRDFKRCSQSGTAQR